MIKNIVVVGGGTAGWLTAIYANMLYPKTTVTVVASSDIGILGAGEATTPHFVFLLSFLKINIIDFIKSTNATFKNGIKFSNFGPTDYYHNFYDPFNINEKNNLQHLNDFLEPSIDFSYVYSKLYNADINNLFLASSISDSYLAPVYKEKINENTIDLKSYITWGLHFDASLVAQYLEKIAVNRGIIRIDSKISKVKTDDFDNITQINLENKQNLPVDFVFDATGFSRVLIGNFYKSKWISHQKHLTVNRALPFVMPKSIKIEPYTKATAMKYGWAWKIPLQTRYGCGYVYNDNYLTVDDAIREIKEKFGVTPSSDKTFSFDAGYFNKIWIKNCLAVGLAANFIEPLESTSIMQTIRILVMFFSNQNNISEQNESKKQVFNLRIEKDILETMSFVHLHYITNKNDSEFWKYFKNKKYQPDQVKNILKILKNEVPSYHDIDLKKSQWSYSSYLAIIFGNDLIKQDVLKKYDFYRNRKQYFEERVFEIQKNKDILSDHKLFLESL